MDYYLDEKLIERKVFDPDGSQHCFLDEKVNKIEKLVLHQHITKIYFLDINCGDGIVG